MMKHFPLIWSNLFRKKVRTILTLLSITTAFLLFGLLQAINQGFSNGASSAKADRMITNSKYSIMDTMPVSYLKQIEAVPGVEKAAFATWFGGRYRDKPAPFAIFPVVPDAYLALVPELQISAQALAAWNSTRSGVVVGEALAKRMQWKAGDKLAIDADIWPKADGALTWTFDIVGTFHNTRDPATGDLQVLVRHDYFDEARRHGKGTASWYYVKIKDRNLADQVGKAIDTVFANSEHETMTQTEQSFAQAFASQFGDIAMIVSAILGAVFFTILVLTGNAMSQALRERMPELGILKTLGFSDGAIWWLVLAESMLLALLGASAGLLLASAGIQLLQAVLAGFGISALGSTVVLQGLGVAVLLGAAVGIPPALKAMRVNIVDALAV